MKGTLVIGSLPRIVAPVARSLHARGIPVHGACIGPEGRKVRSRVLRSFTALGSAEENPAAFFEALRQTIVTHDIDTVMACGDEVLQALASCDEALRAIVNYTGPAPAACRKILQKRETLALAASAGVPVPVEHSVADGSVLREMRGVIRFPVVVKPKNKDGETITGIKNEIVRSFEELNGYFERFPEFGSWFLIQEYIPGYGVAVEILMDGGNPLATFQHRRLREFPVRGGVSVVAVSEAPDPEIVEHGVALLRALRWQGVAMVEFRKDDSSGRLALMEVNGRFWGSVALSLSCGLEFPYRLWQLAHGQRPSSSAAYPVGARFRWLAGDVKRLYECLTSRGSSRTTEVARFFGEFRTSKDATWSWRDPVPAMEEVARAMASVLLMGAGALARRFVPGTAYRRLKALRRAGAAQAASYVKCRYVSRPGVPVDWPRAVRSVVFICHGNIMRSPMAAALFRAAGSGIKVKSAGTAATPGRDVDARAAQVAREFGVSLEGHTATHVSADTVAGGDLLVVMDYLNYVSLLKRFPEAAAKTMLLGAGRRGPVEIDDPYEGSLDDIRTTFRNVEQSTRELIRRLGVKETSTA